MALLRETYFCTFYSRKRCFKNICKRNVNILFVNVIDFGNYLFMHKWLFYSRKRGFKNICKLNVNILSFYFINFVYLFLYLILIYSRKRGLTNICVLKINILAFYFINFVNLFLHIWLFYSCKRVFSLLTYFVFTLLILLIYFCKYVLFMETGIHKHM